MGAKAVSHSLLTQDSFIPLQGDLQAISNRMQSMTLNKLYSLTKKYGVTHEGKTWVRISIPDFALLMRCAEPTVKRNFKKLKDLNFIESAHFGPKLDRTNYYTINHDVVEAATKALRIKCQDPQYLESHPSWHRIYGNEELSVFSAFGPSDQRCPNNNKEIYINKSSKAQEEGQAPAPSASKAIYTLEGKGKNAVGSFKATTTVVPVETTKPRPPKRTCVQDMHRITKEILGDKVDYKLDTKTSCHYMALYNFLGKSLDKFREYLYKIKRCSYFMAEKFNMTVSWVLKFSTFERFQTGEWGVKEVRAPFHQERRKENFNHKNSKLPPENRHISKDKIKEEVKKSIPIDEPESCQKIRQTFLKRLTDTLYRKLFLNPDLPTKILPDGTIECANSFMKASFYNEPRAIEIIESMNLKVECR